MEEGDRPWLKPHVHTPAARDPQPGQTRKRPLIYVYELPPFYNAVMLQVCARHGGEWGRFKGRWRGHAGGALGLVCGLPVQTWQHTFERMRCLSS